MPNILALAPSTVGQPRAGRIYGQVSTLRPAPASFTDTLYVVIPQWHDAYCFPIIHWSACHGATLPAHGADCILVVDDQRNMRCVWWDGVYSAASNATEINGVVVPLTSAAWIAPTLVNSWVNVGGTAATAGYLKDPIGFVHLRGRIHGGTSGSTAFTLPAGYRPSATDYYSGVIATGASPGYVVIEADGTVLVGSGSGSTADNSLAVPPFLAEN